MATCRDSWRSYVSALTVVVALTSATSASAQIGPWSPHTSFQEVTSVDIATDRFWAGSTGGVFSVDRTTGEIERYTIVDGLHAVSSQTIAFDEQRQVVWLGYVDGVLDRIDPVSGTISSFRDIARADQFATRGINNILVRGDSLLISTDFGVVVFDPILEEVRDSYTRLGSLPPATRVNDLTIAAGSPKEIFVATDQGVALADFNAINLQDPLSWSIEDPGQGIVTAVQSWSGQIYVGTESGLFTRSAPDDYSFVNVSSRQITDLNFTTQGLFGTERFRVFGIFSTGAMSFVSSSFENPVAVAVDGEEMIIADLVRGMVRAATPGFGQAEIQVQDIIVPAGPASGVFTDLSVGGDGTLLAGGSPESSSGFFALSTAGDWTSYTGSQIPEISGTSRYTRVHQDVEGTIWASSEGSGVASVSRDGTVVLYNEGNSSLLSATGFPGFIIAAGVTTDNDNTLWVTTRGSTQPIHTRTPDGVWTGRGPLVGDGLTTNSTAFDKIYNDSFNQKWIIVRDPTAFNIPIGVIVLDDNRTPDDPGDDSFRYFSQKGSAGQGLPSNRITSVAEDKNGRLWIGTEEGPAYFVNTGVVARDQLATAIWPQLADRSQGVFLYFGLPINDIAVDPASRLWFATNEGVRIVRELEGGFEEIAHLTTENSPLPSDVVVAIEVRASTGEVFIATEQGMVSTTTDAVAPETSVQDLVVYPNPLVVSGGGEFDVTIEGLTDETLLRISTVDGRVVRTYQTRGGRVQWDGRNEDGELAQSGMYLIIAVSQRGEGTAFGKVAVIN